MERMSLQVYGTTDLSCFRSNLYADEKDNILLGDPLMIVWSHRNG